MERPECAGWHETDPICDGDRATGEAPCAYRERCLVMKGRANELRSSEGITFEKAIAATIFDVDGLDEGAIDEALADLPRVCAIDGTAWKGTAWCPSCARLTGEVSEPVEARERPVKRGSTPSTPPDPSASVGASEPPVSSKEDTPPLPPINDTKGGKVMTARKLHSRPDSRYGHVLPIIDVFAATFAKKTGKRLLREGDPDTRPGDLYLRYTPGMGGRLIGLYEATDRGTRRHRLITRLVMLVREPRFNLKTNIPAEKFGEAVACTPPVGPECRCWLDSKPHVALVGVDAHATNEAARWLVACYRQGLVDDVKRRGTARTRAGVAS